jgi:hypothetical protein
MLARNSKALIMHTNIQLYASSVGYPIDLQRLK